MAERLYERFVLSGVGKEMPWKDIRGRVLLGSEGFVRKLEMQIVGAKEAREIPRLERFSARPPLLDVFGAHRGKKERNRLIRTAHLQYGYSLREIADHLGIHYSTASKVVSQADDGEDRASGDKNC